jgi:hypothetical protein
MLPTGTILERDIKKFSSARSSCLYYFFFFADEEINGHSGITQEVEKA